MPLQRHCDDGLHIAPDESTTIRFTMSGNGRPITVDLPLSVMRAEFGESRLEPLADFATLREVIEATASQAYDAAAEPGDRLCLAAANFTTEASRTYLQTQGRS